jgi:hypothetical protein
MIQFSISLWVFLNHKQCNSHIEFTQAVCHILLNFKLRNRQQKNTQTKNYSFMRYFRKIGDACKNLLYEKTCYRVDIQQQVFPLIPNPLNQGFIHSNLFNLCSQ